MSLWKGRWKAAKRRRRRAEIWLFSAAGFGFWLFVSILLKKPISMPLFSKDGEIFGGFCPKLDKIGISSKKAKKMY